MEDLDRPPAFMWFLILALPFVGTAIAAAVSITIYLSDIGG